jgi:hypothetical protein
MPKFTSRAVLNKSPLALGEAFVLDGVGAYRARWLAIDPPATACQHWSYVISPTILSGFGPGGRRCFAVLTAIIHRTVFVFCFAAVVSLLGGGCTSEPLISRKGVSGLALGEIGLETIGSIGARIDPSTLELEEVNYIGGFIPVKSSAFGGEPRVDNGTRFFVDGHKRGMVPWVGRLRKPGPHRVRLEFPAFEPYTLTLGDPALLHTPLGDVEAWPPVIVHMLTGEIFTSQETSAMDVDRNRGTREKTDVAKKAGRDPLLIVTTTTKVNPAWRQLGRMRVAGRTPGTENGNGVQERLAPMSLNPNAKMMPTSDGNGRR